MQNHSNQSALSINFYRSPDNAHSITVLTLDNQDVAPYVLCNAQGWVKSVGVDDDGLQERAVSAYLTLSLQSNEKPPHYRVIAMDGGYKGIVTLQGSDGECINFAVMEVNAGVRTQTYETEQDAVTACFLLVSALGGVMLSQPYENYLHLVYPELLFHAANNASIPD